MPLIDREVKISDRGTVWKETMQPLSRRSLINQYLNRWQIGIGWGEYNRAKNLIVDLLSSKNSPDLEYEEIVNVLIKRCKI